MSLWPLLAIVCATVAVGEIVCALLSDGGLIKGERGGDRHSCLSLLGENPLNCNEEPFGFAIPVATSRAQSPANTNEKKLYTI
jgi:hypothetical protein